MKFLLLALLAVLASTQANIEELERNDYSELEDLYHIEADEVGEEDLKADIYAVDWRKLNAVTPVQAQGHFYTSWAFAAAGAIESRHFLANRKLVSLSKQNLIDCCQFKKNFIMNGLYCIKLKGGIATENSYPYLGDTSACKFNSTSVTIGAKVTAVNRCPQGNEVTLAKMVAKGPVAASISTDVIDSYTKGIHDTKCKKETKTRYSVLIVGYGTDPHEGDYWLLRTSLGDKWGEAGYLRLGRNRGNLCNIADNAAYPVIQKEKNNK